MFGIILNTLDVLFKYQIDGPIEDYATFYGPVEEGAPDGSYNNNFNLRFIDVGAGGIFLRIREYLRQKNIPFDREQAESFIKELYQIDTLDENWFAITINAMAFSHYYHTFPEQADDVLCEMEKHERFDTLSREYKKKIYHVFAYMRTQPGTSTGMIIN